MGVKSVIDDLMTVVLVRYPGFTICFRFLVFGCLLNSLCLFTRHGIFRSGVFLGPRFKLGRTHARVGFVIPVKVPMRSRGALEEGVAVADVECLR